jgi:hypothetical protein
MTKLDFAAGIAAMAVFAAGTVVGTLLYQTLGFGPFADGAAPYALVFLSIVLPAWLAAAIWRRVRRKSLRADTGSRRRTVSRIILALYVITAAFGVPAVQTMLVRHALEHLASSSPDRAHVSVVFSVPVLPAVILTYHEYQLAPLEGWGGWEVHVWYVGGASSIIRLPLWVS